MPEIDWWGTLSNLAQYFERTGGWWLVFILLALPIGLNLRDKARRRQPRRQDQQNSYRPHHPTNDEEYKAALLSELRRYVEQQKASAKQARADYQSAHSWTKLTTAGVWLYTFLTIAITYSAISQLGQTEKATTAAQKAATAADSSAKANVGQLQEMKHSGRAWLSPLGAALTRQIADGFPIGYSVTYQNTGREPALDVVSKIVPDVARNIPPIIDWDNAKFPANDACSALYPKEGAKVVYPTSSTGLSSNSYTDSGELRDTPLAHLIFDATVNRTVIFVINGCFAYRTCPSSNDLRQKVW